MSLLDGNTRTERGASLKQYLVDGQSAINRLISYSDQLLALKTTVVNDIKYDETDEADVQAVIDDLTGQISNINFGVAK